MKYMKQVVSYTDNVSFLVLSTTLYSRLRLESCNTKVSLKFDRLEIRNGKESKVFDVVRVYVKLAD